MPLNKFSSRFSLSFLIFLLVCFLSNTAFAQDSKPTGGASDPLVSQGEAIFKANCSSCHKLGSVKVGPALSGAVGRWGSEAKMIDFIKHPAVTATKDPYAKTLLAKFAPTVMPNQDFLKDDELKAIAAYIKGGKDEEIIKGPGKNPVPGETKAETPYMLYTLIVIVLILLVIVLCLILVVVKKYLKDKEATLATEDKELVNQKFSIKAVVKSNIFITIISLLFIGVAAKSCWVGLMGIGIEQSYAPKQPIPFSHKLHAGQYKINCNYCHTGVTKGKQANIPSLNICMNCHSQIKTGPSGDKALADLRDHYARKTPVKWVRVHNLPDLAYFNHSQHVKVGGIECQTCHGSIDSMDVVKQHSNLTMGWCINCHRETAVNGKGNAYYDKLIADHNKYSKKELTVAEIGGLECSKCHY
ncbi:MAG: c-type cytochrome [Cytophagaceae bacterium]